MGIATTTTMSCPCCGNVMLATYQQMPRTDKWRWVWVCQTCRYVVPITDAH